MKKSVLFNEFFQNEKAGGIILIACSVLSLLIANSALGLEYISIFQFQIGSYTLEHLINEGLMTIFFLLIGLELKREIKDGHLSTLKSAGLPLFAALGGMLVPACIYFIFNYHIKGANGVGIPMATDIAFALAMLSLLGNRVPAALKVFLTALAVIDDLGAISVIAIFYSKQISLFYLLMSLIIFCLLLVLNRLKLKTLVPYLAGGLVMWYCMSLSGVHSTIAGVLLAFAIPYSGSQKSNPSSFLQHVLHVPVAFLILPLFALCNTAILICGNLSDIIYQPNSLGIMAGLLIGKPLGIFLFSLLGVSIGISTLPASIQWKHIFGAGLLGGIGFTMSVFISQLAFDNATGINNSKLMVILSSALAALIGFCYQKLAFRK
ncbi:MAG: nhaA [Bacteroidetes bacterium]|nr:nhaA [Bacteroidota bacterium]